MNLRRKPLLLLLLGAIAVTAALGIAAVFVSDLGDTHAKLLGTSACVTGAGILVLGSLAALERGRVRAVAVAGIAATLGGFGLLVVGMWAEIDGGGFWKLAGTLLWISGWAAVVSIQSRARLAPRFRWSFLASAAVSAALSALGIAAVWGEFSSGGYWRAFGALAILTGAFILAVPLLHRASRGQVEAAEAEGRPVEVRFCPNCAHRVADGVCPACGARFTVTFQTVNT